MSPGKAALYSPEVSVMTEFSLFGLTNAPGILTPTPDNPFHNWNIFVINYVTGDFHVGNNDFLYTDGEGNPAILHHRGYHNFQLAKEACLRFFPSADKLLIMGGSAGAFAVPALAGEIIDAYPACQDVTVYSDSATIRYDFGKAMRDVWKAKEEIASAAVSDDLSADLFKRLYSQKGDSIRYLFSNSYRDHLFATFQNYIDSGSYTVTEELCKCFTSTLREHVSRLRSGNPTMCFYLSDQKPVRPDAPGTEHGLTVNEGFLKHPVDGVTCAQWLWNAVNGSPEDVGMRLLNC